MCYNYGGLFMLFENVVGFCADMLCEYGESCCNIRCTHPSGKCSGNCDNCLKEVHFSWEADKRKDYCCEKLIYNYVSKFARRYMNNAIIALDYNIDVSQYPYFNVFSVGCGAAPDLMALESICGNKQISYYGYDRNPLWRAIHNCITQYTRGTYNIESVFTRKDIFEVISENNVPQNSFNVIFIQYLISHLYNTNQVDLIDELYQGLIDLVVSQKPNDSPFLIVINDIDSWNKGRSYFHKFLDYLEDAGYSGRAVAYSLYENGDLGRERWGNNVSRRGRIDYSYVETPTGFEGAALIIEVR